MFFGPRRHHATWLVLVAFVVATLLPGLSRAMSHAQAQSAPWAVVCTATDAPSGTPAGDIAHLFDHCPACHLQADGAAAPPVQAPGLVLLPAARLLPLLFLQAPRLLPAWATAQPRAPPAFS